MNAAKLYLDEQGLLDHQQLDLALREERTFVTHNVRDFVKLHSYFLDRHYGIVVSNQDSLGIILRRLLCFLSKETTDSARGKLFWLSNYELPPRHL